MVLNSPLLDKEIEIASNQLELFKLRAMRTVTNRYDMDDLQVIMEQIAAESSKLEGFEKNGQSLFYVRLFPV